MTPIAAYNDIDSLLASYCLDEADPFAKITEHALSRGWRLRTRDEAMTFERVTPAAIQSVEIVRIERTRNGCVAAAWLQLDVPPQAVDTSVELKWAKKYLWPELRRVKDDRR